MSDAYDAYVGLFPTAPEPKPEHFETARTILTRTNAAVANIDLNRLIDPSFVRSAVSRGLAR